MDIVTCVNCGNKVIPKADASCPACGQCTMEETLVADKDLPDTSKKPGQWMLTAFKLSVVCSVFGLIYGLVYIKDYLNPSTSNYFMTFIPALVPLWFGFMLLQGYVKLNRK